MLRRRRSCRVVGRRSTVEMRRVVGGVEDVGMMMSERKD